MDLNELIAQREALNKQITEQQNEQRSLARENARRLVAEFSITPLELGFAKKHGATGSKIQPKFRDPETGNTWTGRGRAPAWIKGQEYARFAITSSSK